MRQETGLQPERSEIIRIQYGDSDHPHRVLGRHMTDEGQLIRAYHPDAVGMRILLSDGRCYEMEPETATRVYAVYIPETEKVSYQVEASFADGNRYSWEDPYSWEPMLTERDLYLFGKGMHDSIYEKLGAHPVTVQGTDGVSFAVWAPSASRVSVVGDFCQWDGRRYPMRRLGSSGVFELFVPGMKSGSLYKYEIKTKDGRLLLKADPYGNECQLRPANASVVADLRHYQWGDQQHMMQRRKTDVRREPMSVYEVHLPSWRRKGSNGCEMLTYRELAHQLGDYVEEMGYTHVELLGILEHPFDGSWGYQVTGYYAPTSRHGNALDFMYFVDHLHQRGIRVILDWVPGHFPKDEHGLARFDGTCLYEHPDPRRGEQPEWDTLVFHYEKNEVKNFLIANVLFWLKIFHIDAIRVDAVSSMLYLDYGRKEGEWMPNRYGGKEHLEAIAFIKQMNSAVSQYGEGGYMIAEESTAWPGVSQPLESGGLGFALKWNMGWMHDFLDYMKLDPIYRKYDHHKLTFSMMYAYSEHFILVLSHDEVVHMKGSMIRKMPGGDFDRFASLRTAYGFMYGHPGKKLLFMGQEFGQWAEWDENRSLDWWLLSYDNHGKLHNYMKKLLHLYKEYGAFYELDDDPAGFAWMSCDNAEESNVSFVRRDRTGEQTLLFVCNFVPVFREKIRIPVPGLGRYELILNSDEEQFGGSGRWETNGAPIAEEISCDGQTQGICVNLPPLSILIYERKGL